MGIRARSTVMIQVRKSLRGLCYLLAVAMLVGGCAEVPLASSSADAEGKRFAPPPSGRSTIYAYRSALLGREVAFNLSDDRQPLGVLADNTWIRVDVVPGNHTIGCSVVARGAAGTGTVNEIQLDLAPGETRFVEARIWPGPPLNPRCIVTEVSPDEGRSAVTRGRRAL